MNEELKKPYNPATTEDLIYKEWDNGGYFNPDKCVEMGFTEPQAETFSIVLPPPNATDKLHVGSALMLAIEDIMVRFNRMLGKKTLWLPGTDHAALATHSKVEKILYKEEGKTRHELGRENFAKKVEEFVEINRGLMKSQMPKLGASLDWSREAYTLDAKRSQAVIAAFKQMYEEGLIYRGYRVVNWDPKGQTTVSDEEVEHTAEKSTLYTFKYSKDFPIAISTTRPETKVGDSAVAVHPDDERYKKYVGQVFEVPFADTKLTLKVIADPAVDPGFGTGALGVTPAHSLTDFEMSQRHNLEIVPVINEYAKMTEAAGPLLVGKKTKEARAIIVEWLRNSGLLQKEEEVDMNLSVSERTGGVIEPLPKLQWFVDVHKPIAKRGNKSLKELMREAVEIDHIQILPEQFERVYLHWVGNLRDWCISRQIWYGHRIPVWYKGEGIFIGEKPDGEGWEQDPDTLDTWFSSALWTFTTLGWPEQTDDLKTYHPTTVLETGYDILPFWVVRMILMSKFLLGEIPFKTVYLHGLVRDEKGRKISKSLGNNIDPVDLINKFGADALRMALIIGVGPGRDSKLGEDKIKAYKHFANKIWNASRFVTEQTDNHAILSPDQLTEADKQVISEFDSLVADLTLDMENYRFYLAGEKAYHYFWHTFADKIIEDCKTRIKNGEETDSARSLLFILLENQLKILHPFMPFITEKIWGMLPNRRNMLIVEKWPKNLL